jgi:hypothetical protein
MPLWVVITAAAALVDCRGGEYATENGLDGIKCLPCPSGRFSLGPSAPAEALAEEEIPFAQPCLACPRGRDSSAGATACVDGAGANAAAAAAAAAFATTAGGAFAGAGEGESEGESEGAKLEAEREVADRGEGTGCSAGFFKERGGFVVKCLACPAGRYSLGAAEDAAPTQQLHRGMEEAEAMRATAAAVKASGGTDAQVRAIEKAADGFLTPCAACPAGRYGKGASVSAACDGACPAGRWSSEGAAAREEHCALSADPARAAQELAELTGIRMAIVKAKAEARAKAGAEAQAAGGEAAAANPIAERPNQTADLLHDDDFFARKVARQAGGGPESGAEKEFDWPRKFLRNGRGGGAAAAGGSAAGYVVGAAAAAAILLAVRLVVDAFRGGAGAKARRSRAPGATTHLQRHDSDLASGSVQLSTLEEAQALVVDEAGRGRTSPWQDSSSEDEGSLPLSAALALARDVRSTTRRRSSSGFPMADE